MITRVEFDPASWTVGAAVDTNRLHLRIRPLPTISVVIEPDLHAPLRAFLERVIEDWEDTSNLRAGAKGYLRHCVTYRRRPRVRGIVGRAIEYDAAERNHRKRRRRVGA